MSPIRKLAALSTVLAFGAMLGLGAGPGIGLSPANAAQAAAGGYKPSASEWWMTSWSVPQQVWPLTEGAGVTVAVVDSGVQATIPDLRGVVLRGGDVIGYQGHGDVDYATVDQDGHGTTVAVMIAGQGYGTGTVGIAPRAKILPVHVAYPELLNGTAHMAAGIDYAVKHGAQVINVSLGEPAPSQTSCDPVLQDAVAYALARGVVVVASSGDTNLGGPGPEEPGSCAGVLAVGAVGKSGSIWPYSTRGPYVSVVAPGDHMDYVGSDGRYDTVGSGTSFSSPLVAGAAALIRSRYPSMPWYQVVQRLIGTAIHINTPVPNNNYGYGVIDVAKAVNAAAFPVKASSPDPVYARYLSWLRGPAGRTWAKANGVRVPGTASSTTASSDSGRPAAANAASTGKAAAPAGSGGLGTVLIVIIVVVVAAIAAAIGLILRSRNRARRDLPARW